MLQFKRQGWAFTKRGGGRGQRGNDSSCAIKENKDGKMGRSPFSAVHRKRGLQHDFPKLVTGSNYFRDLGKRRWWWLGGSE